MAGFTINPDPKFTEPVIFRLPGGKLVTIRVDFNFLDSADYAAHFEAQRGKSDAEIAASIASGWDAAEPFGVPALEKLFRTYPTAARAFFATFRNAIYGAAEGN